MKYIIESNDVIGYTPKYAMLFGDGYMIQRLEDLEELNSDYINEHFSDLQDTAYRKELEDGKKATWGLVADASGAEYQRGLDDAWEAARKIADMWDRMDNDELLEIFGVTAKLGESTIGCLFKKQTATEAIEKLKAYEEKQKSDDEIKVGDEVSAEDGTSIFIVTWMSERCLCGVDKEGRCYSYEWSEICGKTGNHYNIVFEEMRG